MRILKKQDGSITIEATMIFPIVLCTIVCIAFLIKLVFLHAYIQNTITDVADELSAFGYVLTVTGAEDLNNDIFNKIETNSERIGQYFEDITGGIVNSQWSSSYINKLGARTMEELKGIAFRPIIKELVKQKIEENTSVSADRYLKRMHILNGIEGLDFGGTTFLEGGKDINIVVKYTVDLPLPVDILPNIKVIQSTVVRAWLSGEKLNPYRGDEIGNIWDLPPLERGRKIQKIFGRSDIIPHNFPVIAKFEGGKAVSIKSINLNSASYTKGYNIKKRMLILIDELYDFSGGKTGNYEIKKNEILFKELLIVVPKGSISEEIQLILDECRAVALSKGLAFVIREL